MSLFKRASKSRSRLRMAISGPSGVGKTWTSLAIASGLAGPGGRIAVIDTEHGSASKYAGDFDFDVLELEHFDPRSYIEAIQAAEGEGFDVLVIDSLSHEWNGRGGALELVDKTAKRKQGNSFASWGDVTPLHNAFIDAIIRCSCHVIATMRTKSDYVLEADANTGKMAPRKVGLAAIQRDGMEYEFDIEGRMDLDHNLVIGKTRFSRIDGEIFSKPGKKLGVMLAGWLSDGVPEEKVEARPAGASAIGQQNGHHLPVQAAQASSPVATPLASADQVRELIHLRAYKGIDDRTWLAAMAKRGVADASHLLAADAEEMIGKLRTRPDVVAAAPADPGNAATQSVPAAHEPAPEAIAIVIPPADAGAAADHILATLHNPKSDGSGESSGPVTDIDDAELAAEAHVIGGDPERPESPAPKRRSRAGTVAGKS